MSFHGLFIAGGHLNVCCQGRCERSFNHGCPSAKQRLLTGVPTFPISLQQEIPVAVKPGDVDLFSGTWNCSNVCVGYFRVEHDLNDVWSYLNSPGTHTYKWCRIPGLETLGWEIIAQLSFKVWPHLWLRKDFILLAVSICFIFRNSLFYFQL